MPRLDRRLLTLGLAMGAALPPLGAQGRLADALATADRRALANRAAEGQALERAGQALAPLRGILPSLRLESNVARTTDPLGTFGAPLRQRRLEAADFDPARLNHPAAVSNVGAAVVADLPIFNADAWLGRAAASRAVAASRASADWTRAATRADVIRAWYGTLLADEGVATLEAALRSGAAHVRQAESLQTNGMVTASDALVAQVKAGELEADLASARADRDAARRELAALVFGAGTETLAPDGALPTPERLRAVAAEERQLIGVERADVRAARAGADAARRDAGRARAALLPRVNGFARYDWNDPSRPVGGEKSWTVGAVATWSLFTSAPELADLGATTGRATAARAMADGALTQAALAAARATADVDVALQRLAIAERGTAQAADAHRIVARRYDGGLATVVELLDVAAAETRQQTQLARARFDVVAALTARRLALGLDPAALAALDSAPVTSKESDR
jgi:outer membrane protein TolC